MLIKTLQHCLEFTAADNTALRELLHPHKADLKLGYSLAHAVLRPGETSLLHRLRKSSEVYYILEGRGLMYINGESSEVAPGQAVYIPPNATQCIKNTGDTNLIFLCMVDPAWQPEDEEVFYAV